MTAVEIFEQILAILTGTILAPLIYAGIMKIKPEWIVGPVARFLSLFITDKKWVNKVSNSVGLLLINTGKHIITYQPDDKKTEELIEKLNDILTELLLLHGGDDK